MAHKTGRSLIFKTLIILVVLCMMISVTDAKKGGAKSYRAPSKTTRVTTTTTTRRVRRASPSYRPSTRYVRVYHAPVGYIVVVPNMQPVTYMCQQDLMNPYVYQPY